MPQHSLMPFHRYWQDWTTAELAAVDKDQIVALLPVAAIEQHGPHLPLSTDAAINRAIVDTAVERMSPELPVVVLPAQEIGLSPEHCNFAGTLTVEATTLSRLWTEIGDSLARTGVRKLLIFNSHGGQPQVMEGVAQDLRLRHSMLAAHVSWFDFGVPDGMFDAEELAHGIHGGALETSIMLYAEPGSVRLDKLADFPTEGKHIAEDFRWLGPTGPVPFGWMSEDLNRQGAMGNATAADADKGRQLVEHLARCLIETLQEVKRFDPPFD
ncbi:MAG: creatininase family protein [Pseudomonadota bacterium]